MVDVECPPQIGGKGALTRGGMTLPGWWGGRGRADE